MFNRKNSKKSFEKYIVYWTISFTIIPIMMFGIFSLIYINHSSKMNVAKHIEDTIKTSDTLLAKAIKDIDGKLDRFVTDKNIINAINTNTYNEGVNDEAFALLGNKSSSIALHIVGNNDFTFSTTVIPKMYNIAKFDNWGVLKFAVSRNNNEVYPNSYKWENGINNAFTVTKKIFDHQRLIGYVIVDFSSNFIKDLIEPLSNDYLGNVKFVMVSDYNYEIFNNTDFNNNIHINSSFFKSDINENYTYRIIEDKEINVKTMGVMENSFVNNNIKVVSLTMLSASIPSILLALLTAYILKNRLIKPITKLTDRVNCLECDSEFITDKISDIKEISTIEYAFNDLLKKIKNYHFKDIEKHKMLRITELKALQSQINPHFLYNTLDSIKWEAKLHKVDKIAKIATEFGSVLKACMNFNETIVTVEKEMNLIKSYIFIQKERYSDRFDFEIKIDESIMDCMIPKLIIQPLVENAVVHGMESISEKGRITVEGYAENEYLIFNIKDNGNGFKEDFNKLIDDNTNNGIGLFNVNKRIKLYYGDDYNLKLIDDCNSTYIQVKVLKDIRGKTNV